MRDVSALSDQFGFTIKTFIDVGARYGETSMRALTAFPRSQVIAFEPTPASFKIMIRKIASPRFTAHPIALSDKEGTANLTLSDEKDSTNSITSYGRGSTTIEVPCSTLNSFCRTNGITGIDVLKVDTEGHDIAVLHGASNILPHTQFVCSEFFHLTDEEKGTTLFGLNNLLQQYGFDFVAAYTEIVERAALGLFTVMDALFMRRPSPDLGTPSRPGSPASPQARC
jgi:FkbM family methyltransferase